MAQDAGTSQGNTWQRSTPPTERTRSHVPYERGFVARDYSRNFVSCMKKLNKCRWAPFMGGTNHPVNQRNTRRTVLVSKDTESGCGAQPQPDAPRSLHFGLLSGSYKCTRLSLESRFVSGCLLLLFGHGTPLLHGIRLSQYRGLRLLTMSLHCLQWNHSPRVYRIFHTCLVVLTNQTLSTSILRLRSPLLRSCTDLIC